MNTANIYELTPKHDSAKSFYGKARIESHQEGEVKSLRSYDTVVATMYSPESVLVTTNPAHLTATTLRHIKEFLKQHGFKAETKKQIVKDYGGGV